MYLNNSTRLISTEVKQYQPPRIVHQVLKNIPRAQHPIQMSLAGLQHKYPPSSLVRGLFQRAVKRPFDETRRAAAHKLMFTARRLLLNAAKVRIRRTKGGVPDRQTKQMIVHGERCPWKGSSGDHREIRTSRSRFYLYIVIIFPPFRIDVSKMLSVLYLILVRYVTR